MKDGNKSKNLNPIVVTLCRDMFRYDANEIVPESDGNNNRDSKDRHPNHCKG